LANVNATGNSIVYIFYTTSASVNVFYSVATLVKINGKTVTKDPTPSSSEVLAANNRKGSFDLQFPTTWNLFKLQKP
jgi:hypothetical protein